MYFRLFKGYEETTFSMRHYPYSEFRRHVSKLERDAMGLLNDTLVSFSYILSFNLNLIIPIEVSDNNSATPR